MKNSAVMSRLVGGETGFLVQDQQSGPRIPQEKFPGRGEPEDAGPDDDDVIDGRGCTVSIQAVSSSDGRRLPSFVRRAARGDVEPAAVRSGSLPPNGPNGLPYNTPGWRPAEPWLPVKVDATRLGSLG